jgi:hypothetical protein
MFNWQRAPEVWGNRPLAFSRANDRIEPNTYRVDSEKPDFLATGRPYTPR